jgi:hypothetical protein
MIQHIARLAIGAVLLVNRAQAAPPCEDIAMTMNTCLGGEVGEVTAEQLACLRSIATDAERDMSTAYQARVQATAATARRELASVQKLWVQSTQANCKFLIIDRSATPHDASDGNDKGAEAPCGHPWASISTKYIR